VVVELMKLRPSNCAADPGNALTYKQMAALFGLSPQRFHQIAVKALKRLRGKAHLLATEQERAA
jgi:DNA-directed RNA polymerase sigma subunit (sigma70/sigma32)